MRIKAFKWIDKWIGTPLIWTISMCRPRSTPLHIQNVTEILVIKLVAIGDLVVLLPTLAALKYRLPECRITLLTTRRVMAVVENQPFIDEIIYADMTKIRFFFDSFWKIIGELRRRKIALCLDFEHYYRFVALFPICAGIPHVAGFDLPHQGKGRIRSIKIPYSVSSHEARNFWRFLSGIGLNASDFSGPAPIPVGPDDAAYVENQLAKLEISGPFIMIHSGTSPIATHRRWSQQNWHDLGIRLATRLAIPILWVIGPTDSPADMPDHPCIFLLDRLTIPQVAYCMKKAVIYVGLDTGPTHIAGAMGCPVVALYGPNTPQKWGPYGSALHRPIYNQLPCSPCIQQYRGRVTPTCPVPRCMQSISVDTVFETIVTHPVIQDWCRGGERTLVD